MVPESCSVFKSYVQPQKYTFKTLTSDNQQSEIKCIFKRGDDIRQDQLVIEIITVMDAILKKQGMDYQFTLYKCLGFTNNDGVMEFVEDT